MIDNSQRFWASYERKVRRRRGKLIRRKRAILGLQQKNIVYALECSQPNVSNIERGQLPRPEGLAALAKLLELPRTSIYSGLDCTIGEEASSRPTVSAIHKTLLASLSDIAGERIGRGAVRFDNLVPRLGPSFLARSIDICNAALEDTNALTTGADLVEIAKGPVRTILDFAQAADQTFKGIPELLFAAHEKVVHCYSCVAPDEELFGLVFPNLAMMSRIADEYERDRSFRQQMLGRKGDVLKVCGRKNSDFYKLALIDLQAALQFPGKLRCQAVRSAFVVGAQCELPDWEREQLSGQCESRLDSGEFSPLEAAHIQQGKSEQARILFGKVSKTDRLGRAALAKKGIDDLMQSTQRMNGAVRAEDTNVEFMLRIKWQEVMLGHTGIREHLGDRGVPAEADLKERALNLREEARATGSTRVQEQMSDIIRSLE